MYAWIPRFLRLSALLFFLLGLFNVITFSSNQSRFQKYLAAHYITWDDFPPLYAETLRSKDWDGLKTDVFDYEHVFPPAKRTSNTIPKTIHFIWFQNLYESRPEVTEIPSIGSSAPSLCAEHNPTYDIKIWNATASRELLETNYVWFLPTYDAYRYPIQRIDAIKYFVLLHYGGVYMDMDIACRRSLDPLLQFPAWFPEASPLGVNNDLMASKAQHPAVQLMVDSLKPRNKNLIFPYLTIFWSTGPQFTGDILKQWVLDGHDDVYIQSASTKDTKAWFVLPQVFYSEEYTFFGHSPGGTWHGDDVAVVLWFVAHPFIFWALAASLFTAFCILPVLYRRRKRNSYLELRKRTFEA